MTWKLFASMSPEGGGNWKPPNTQKRGQLWGRRLSVLLYRWAQRNLEPTTVVRRTEDQAFCQAETFIGAQGFRSSSPVRMWT